MINTTLKPKLICFGGKKLKIFFGDNKRHDKSIDKPIGTAMDFDVGTKMLCALVESAMVVSTTKNPSFQRHVSVSIIRGGQ